MSMLFRFREAQAAELGLSGRTDRRPRVAASCKDLRQCERWRGEILRDISRKVSKIQDSGLTDYEVRDLNDEINKLLREKHHWENQIIALGGANYKRAASTMKDSEGREVPGVRGYKYFGRAKDLPGVRELFQSAAKEHAELESYKTVKPDMFKNVGPGYYGDQDEVDEELIKAEREAEAEGWEEAIETLKEEDVIIEDAPPVPEPAFVSLGANEDGPDGADDPADDVGEGAAAGGKRKASGTAAKAKKAKKKEGQATASEANGFKTILLAEDLKAPKVPSVKELEKYVLERQKAVLMAEYVD
ncbi:Isy1-like splicing factor [Meredithblackwellia eburnea MCA 4105]